MICWAAQDCLTVYNKVARDVQVCERLHVCPRHTGGLCLDGKHFVSWKDLAHKAVWKKLSCRLCLSFDSSALAFANETIVSVQA